MRLIPDQWNTLSYSRARVKIRVRQPLDSRKFPCPLRPGSGENADGFPEEKAHDAVRADRSGVPARSTGAQQFVRPSRRILRISYRSSADGFRGGNARITIDSGVTDPLPAAILQPECMRASGETLTERIV